MRKSNRFTKKIKKIAASALIGATLVSGLAACGKKADADNGNNNKDAKVIEVGVVSGGDKTSFIDDKGNLTGYEVEVLKKIDEELPQYEFHFNPVEGSVLFSSLDAKKFDLISGNFRRSDAREASYFHTYRAFISTPYRIIVFEDNTDINSIKDLEGKRAGTGEGSLMADILNAYVKENNSTIEVVYSTDLVNDLVAGRIDAIIFPGRQVDLYNKSYDNLKFKAVGEPVVGSDGCMKDSNAYFYMRKDDEGAQLRNDVSEVLYKLRQEGYLKELSLKWYGTDLTEGIDEESEQEVIDMYGISK